VAQSSTAAAAAARLAGGGDDGAVDGMTPDAWEAAMLAACRDAADNPAAAEQLLDVDLPLVRPLVPSQQLPSIASTLDVDGYSTGIDGEPAELTPLHVAAKAGNVRVAAALLRRGASSRHEGYAFRLPLLDAVSAPKNALETSRLLLEDGCKPGVAELNAAIRGGTLAMVHLLLDYGVSHLRRHSYLHDVPMEVAVDLPDDRAAPVMRLLRDHGGTLDFVYLDWEGGGATVLSRACRAGNVAKLKKCLAAGASVRLAGPDGVTPLHAVFLRDDDDHRGGAPPVAPYATLVDVLLLGGASLHSRDRYGQTALHYAVMAGDLPALQRLLADSAADGTHAVHAVACDGATPLHLAAGAARADMVDALVAACAHTVTGGPRSPLVEAVRGGHHGVVAKLLQVYHHHTRAVLAVLPVAVSAGDRGVVRLVAAAIRDGSSGSHWLRRQLVTACVDVHALRAHNEPADVAVAAAEVVRRTVYRRGVRTCAVAVDQDLVLAGSPGLAAVARAAGLCGERPGGDGGGGDGGDGGGPASAGRVLGKRPPAAGPSAGAPAGTGGHPPAASAAACAGASAPFLGITQQTLGTVRGVLARHPRPVGGAPTAPTVPAFGDWPGLSTDAVAAALAAHATGGAPTTRLALRRAAAHFGITGDVVACGQTAAFDLERQLLTFALPNAPETVRAMGLLSSTITECRKEVGSVRVEELRPSPW